jgi:hypothetical protein
LRLESFYTWNGERSFGTPRIIGGVEKVITRVVQGLVKKAVRSQPPDVGI